jgi:hypothetical protein
MYTQVDPPNLTVNLKLGGPQTSVHFSVFFGQARENRLLILCRNLERVPDDGPPLWTWWQPVWYPIFVFRLARNKNKDTHEQNGT